MVLLKINLLLVFFLYSFSFSPRKRFVFQTEISGKYIVLALISRLYYFLSSLRRGDQSTVFCMVSTENTLYVQLKNQKSTFCKGQSTLQTKARLIKQYDGNIFSNTYFGWQGLSS